MEADVIKKAPVRSPFARMHERIQNKYEEMQRKIEKSKSMDALHTIGSDSEIKSENGLHSAHNVSDVQINFRRDHLDKSHVSKQDVIMEDFWTKNNDHVAKDESLNFNGYNEINNDDISIFSLSNASLEALNGDEDNTDCTSPLPKAPPRVRLRDKIAAVREKRRRKEESRKEREIENKKNNQEKNNKKRDSLDKEYKKKDKAEPQDKVEKFILSNTTKSETTRFSKRIRTATVTIALIEAKGINLPTTDDKGGPVYCKFRLGLEKFKSKYVKCEPSKVSWLELFNLYVYEEFMLEICLWSKDKQDQFLGRKVIDISEIEREKTHHMRINLESENKGIELFFLLTICGTYLLNTVIDLNDYLISREQMDYMKQKFAWYHLADDYSDVGYLSVLVYGAKGLSVHDAFCVLELGNNRVQTHTEYKTCDPNWMKVFNFTVTDVTSVLELSVCEESKKYEVIGKISIPLLRINNGEKKWYALKDKTQRERAKGNNPRVLLEMRITWHPVRASIRVINPKEVKYLQTEAKLDRHIFARNLSRTKAVVAWILGAIRWTKTCFEWESRKWSFIALVIWLLACWFFEPWMLPMLLLIPFIWYRPPEYRFKGEKYFQNNLPPELFDNDEDTKSEKEEKKSLRERLTSIQEMTQTVQNGIGKAASIGESIKNLVNFTVPYLSFLAIIIILTIGFIMYMIPVKYIFIAWGINKFTRKIRRPNRIPNNEILDLLSRVPDDETLLDCLELPLDDVEDLD